VSRLIRASLARMVKVRSRRARSRSRPVSISAWASSTSWCRRSWRASARGVGTRPRPARTRIGSPNAWRMRPRVRLVAGTDRCRRSAAPVTLPPPRAGVGSAVNDLVRELGGAFGIGVLGSLTLVHYRGRLLGALAGQPAAAGRCAEAGLAQAFAVGGGPGSPVGLAARYAYAAGLDLGMMVGAGCAVVAAVVVCLGLRASGRWPPAGPVPAPDRQSAPDSERLLRGTGP
jgi:hypothetical protein